VRRNVRVLLYSTACRISFLLSLIPYHALVQFTNHAVEIADLTHYEARNIINSIESLSTAITSLKLATDAAESWPNFTLPDFEIRGHMNNRLSKAIQVSFCPLVKKEELEQWNQYSVLHQGWLTESLEVQEDLASVADSTEHRRDLAEGKSPVIPPQLWRYSEGDSGEMIPEDGPGVDFGPGSYAPVWQQSPAPSDPSIINFDLISHPVFKRVYHGMWETRMPVISEAFDLEFIYGGAVHDDSEHPHSALLSPVYPSFNTLGLHDRDDLAGFILAILPWDTYFSNLLVEGVNGVIVVLHDTCGYTFTYQINGPEAVYLGEGDLHEHKYDHLEIDVEFAPFLKHNFSDVHEHCEYDLRIFPSSELEEKFRTIKPGLYAGVVVLVFLFTASVFVLYDFLVQKRQDKVMATAKRTNAVVSSLFPSQVRDRILQDAKEQAEQDMQMNKRGSVFNLGAKSQLKDFLDEGAVTEKLQAYDSKPIADLFPNVTVMVRIRVRARIGTSLCLKKNTSH